MTCQLLPYNLKKLLIYVILNNVNATYTVNCIVGYVRKTARIKRAENVRII